MTTLKTLPNNTTGRRMFEQHTLDIPPCCPVSKNPRPGSKIVISYRAKEQVLEVASLMAYIYRFVGGLHSASGDLVVRDMEGMLLKIAQDCANKLGVPVRVRAELVLLPRQKASVIARGYPEVSA